MASVDRALDGILSGVASVTIDENDQGSLLPTVARSVLHLGIKRTLCKRTRCSGRSLFSVIEVKRHGL